MNQILSEAFGTWKWVDNRIVFGSGDRAKACADKTGYLPVGPLKTVRDRILCIGHDKMYKPLAYPPDWELRHSWFEKFCLWIPVAGWIVGGMIEGAKIGPIRRLLHDQIRSRCKSPEIDWGSTNKKHIADRIGAICQEAVGWPNKNFVRDDHFEAMIEWRTGDLCEAEALMAIQEEFKVTLPENLVDFIGKVTFSDLVDWVDAEQSKSDSHN